MPRTARIFQRALCYHLINRGVNRGRICHDDEDRAQFCELAAEYRDLCGARVYHWCLMDNHYHLLVEIVFDNLRAFVGGLQMTYAKYHHKRHGSSGVFWGQRLSNQH